LSNDHFQRRPDVAFQEMAAVRRAVAFSNDHMRPKHWVALLFCNVPGKREHLHLFLYGNFLIALLFSIKKAKRDFTESTDGSDLCSSKRFFSSEPQQRFFHFIIFIEHERESFEAIFMMQQFRFHTEI